MDGWPEPEGAMSTIAMDLLSALVGEGNGDGSSNDEKRAWELSKGLVGRGNDNSGEACAWRCSSLRRFACRGSSPASFKGVSRSSSAG